MKIKISGLVLSILLLGGCTTPLVIENDYDKVKVFEYSKNEIKDLSYCSIIMPRFARQGVCILTDNELAVYWSKKLGEEANKKLLFKFKYEDIRKIAHRGKARLRQIQVLAKNTYFAIEVAPDASFVDQKKTKEWFDFMLSKGIESFEAPTYMTGPIPQYQIIYK